MFGKNINISSEVLKESRISNLVTNPDWLKLFGGVKDRNINFLKNNLQKKIDEEKELAREIKKLQIEKTQCMKMILGVSDSINNDQKKENLKLLDEYKEKIEKINLDLDDLQYKFESLPKEIREINTELLSATIEYGYAEISEKEKVLESSLEEIAVVRARLQELINIKYDYEEWINGTYKFFHSLLGSEVIEKIDKERLK